MDTANIARLCGDALDSIGKVEAAMTGGPTKGQPWVTAAPGEPHWDEVSYFDEKGVNRFPVFECSTCPADTRGIALARNLLPGTVECYRALLTMATGWLLPGNQRNSYEEWRDDPDAQAEDNRLHALIQANFKAGIDTASPEHQALVREFDAMHRWANGPLYVRHQTRHDAAEQIIAHIARALAPCYAPLADAMREGQ